MVIQPSLGVVPCSVSFVKPTSVNTIVLLNFMLDSCHSLAHFSHDDVLIVRPYSFSINAGDGRLIFVFNFHSHAGVVHIWPAIQLLRPYILSISLICTIYTCISTRLPLTGLPYMDS